MILRFCILIFWYFVELPDKIFDQKPVDDLSNITSSFSGLECFSTIIQTHTEEEIIPSSNPDSPLVNFDVWTDLEEEVMNYVVESFQPKIEEFCLDSTYDEGKNKQYSVEADKGRMYTGADLGEGCRGCAPPLRGPDGIVYKRNILSKRRSAHPLRGPQFCVSTCTPPPPPSPLDPPLRRHHANILVTNSSSPFRPSPA
jgi:hypothetical protein